MKKMKPWPSVIVGLAIAVSVPLTAAAAPSESYTLPAAFAVEIASGKAFTQFFTDYRGWLWEAHKESADASTFFIERYDGQKWEPVTTFTPQIAPLGGDIRETGVEMVQFKVDRNGDLWALDFKVAQWMLGPTLHHYHNGQWKQFSDGHPTAIYSYQSGGQTYEVRNPFLLNVNATSTAQAVNGMPFAMVLDFGFDDGNNLWVAGATNFKWYPCPLRISEYDCSEGELVYDDYGSAIGRFDGLNWKLFTVKDWEPSPDYPYLYAHPGFNLNFPTPGKGEFIVEAMGAETQAMMRQEAIVADPKRQLLKFEELGKQSEYRMKNRSLNRVIIDTNNLRLQKDASSATCMTQCALDSEGGSWQLVSRPGAIRRSLNGRSFEYRLESLPSTEQVALALPSFQGTAVYLVTLPKQSTSFSFRAPYAGSRIFKVTLSDLNQAEPQAQRAAAVVAREKSASSGITHRTSANLRGAIAIQVEQSGEAWYIDPASSRRHYLADGSSAYQLLRKLGTGIRNVDLQKIPVGLDATTTAWERDSDFDGLGDSLEEALGTKPDDYDMDSDGYLDGTEVKGGFNPSGTGRPSIDASMVNRVKGKILLQVESRGQAWYVNPADGKRYYLKDGDVAYELMRRFGRGVKNSQLRAIPVGD